MNALAMESTDWNGNRKGSSNVTLLMPGATVLKVSLARTPDPLS